MAGEHPQQEKVQQHMRLYRNSMKKEFENIELSESVVLGWKVIGNVLTLYMEFLLTSLHKEFVDFDPAAQFGCYRIGQIDFFNIRNLKGLDSEILMPSWNANLNEYNDVYEVDSLVFENSLVKIQANSLLLTFEYSKFNLNLEKTDKFKD